MIFIPKSIELNLYEIKFDSEVQCEFFTSTGWARVTLFTFAYSSSGSVYRLELTDQGLVFSLDRLSLNLILDFMKCDY